MLRISSQKLHIKDPVFFNDIYASNAKMRDKYERQIKSRYYVQANRYEVARGVYRERRDASKAFPCVSTELMFPK